MNRRVRAVCVLMVLIVPVMAGCFAGRSRTPANARPTAPTTLPTATPDSIKMIAIAGDSARKADSAKGGISADSAKKLSASADKLDANVKK